MSQSFRAAQPGPGVTFSHSVSFYYPGLNLESAVCSFPASSVSSEHRSSRCHCVASYFYWPSDSEFIQRPVCWQSKLPWSRWIPFHWGSNCSVFVDVFGSSRQTVKMNSCFWPLMGSSLQLILYFNGEQLYYHCFPVDRIWFQCRAENYWSQRLSLLFQSSFLARLSFDGCCWCFCQSMLLALHCCSDDLL